MHKNEFACKVWGYMSGFFDIMYINLYSTISQYQIAHRSAVQLGVECDSRQALQVFKTDLELGQLFIAQLTIGNHKRSQCEEVRV